MNVQHTIPIASSRSGLIFALSAAAFLLLGPIAGIPAWLMARQDLQDIRAGFISPTAQRPLMFGKWFAIVGTFLSPLWLLVFAIILFVVAMVTAEVSLQSLGIGRW